MKDARTREYEPSDLELYARYRDQRALYRPAACRGTGLCWVEQGPPAITGTGGNAARCKGCGDSPRLPPGQPTTRYRK